MPTLQILPTSGDSHGAVTIQCGSLSFRNDNSTRVRGRRKFSQVWYRYLLTYVAPRGNVYMLNQVQKGGQELELLTPREVAGILKVAAWTVCRYCREGKLRGIKTTAGWRIESAAVNEYLGAAADYSDERRTKRKDTDDEKGQ